MARRRTCLPTHSCLRRRGVPLKRAFLLPTVQETLDFHHASCVKFSNEQLSVSADEVACFCCERGIQFEVALSSLFVLINEPNTYYRISSLFTYLISTSELRVQTLLVVNFLIYLLLSSKSATCTVRRLTVKTHKLRGGTSWLATFERGG